MILTKKEVLEELRLGNLKITPFNKSNLCGASYDLTLDDDFRFFTKDKAKINNNIDFKKYTKRVKSKFIILKPGDFVLGITKETIKLPGNICGWLSGRSRFARMGILVHITANFVQPDCHNKQVLEIYNASPMTLKLEAGTKIMQIIFQRTESSVKYKGKFARQTSL